MPSGAALRAGNAIIELSWKTGATEAGLRKVEQMMMRVGAASQRMSMKAAVAIRNMSRSIDKASKKLGSLATKLSSAGTSMLMPGLAAGGAFVWAGKMSADLEKARAEFKALTGSGEMAGKMLAELEAFANRTPFNTPELQQAARTLLGYGVAAEDVVATTKQLGAVAGGDADRLQRLAIAFAQTQAKGKLAAEEVRQMVNAGFNPLSEISRKTGESMGQLTDRMKDGAISAKEVAEAFESVSGPGGRFGTLMDEISRTAYGVFDRVRGQVLSLDCLALEIRGDATGDRIHAVSTAAGSSSAAATTADSVNVGEVTRAVAIFESAGSRRILDSVTAGNFRKVWREETTTRGVGDWTHLSIGSLYHGGATNRFNGSISNARVYFGVAAAKLIADPNTGNPVYGMRPSLYLEQTLLRKENDFPDWGPTVTNNGVSFDFIRPGNDIWRTPYGEAQYQAQP